MSNEVEQQQTEPAPPIPIEDDPEDDVQIPVEGPRRLISEPRDLSIRELFTQEQDGDLKLQPEFQRYYVFDDAKASRLVESVLRVGFTK